MNDAPRAHAYAPRKTPITGLADTQGHLCVALGEPHCQMCVALGEPHCQMCVALEEPHCEHKQRVSLASQHTHEHCSLCKLPYGKYVTCGDAKGVAWTGATPSFSFPAHLEHACDGHSAGVKNGASAPQQRGQVKACAWPRHRAGLKPLSTCNDGNTTARMGGLRTAFASAEPTGVEAILRVRSMRNHSAVADAPPRARATAAEMELHHERSCTGWVLGSSMPTLGASAGGAH